MKKITIATLTNILNLIIIISLSVFLYSNNASAQGSVPKDVASIVNMSLKDGQSKLANLGYEICGSSASSRTQSWFNKSAKTCVNLKFDKNTSNITEVTLNNDISKCERDLAAMQKTFEMYHDGQAPASSVKLDLERKKLADKGFKVSYWMKEPSPGRNMEYWINESTKKTMYILYEIQGSKWVKTDKTDFSMGYNPASNKK